MESVSGAKTTESASGPSHLPYQMSLFVFLEAEMPRAGFAEDGYLLLLEGMASDSFTSVIACVVSALVLLHSRILHKRKWKRPRVHTETAAMSTFVGGALLLIGRSHSLSE